MSKKIKIFGIVGILVALGIFGSKFMNKSESPTPTANSNPLTSSAGAGLPVGTSNAPIDNSFSNALSTVKSIVIDTSIFENPSYKILRDYPVVLGSDIIGRTNPFSPVGVDSPSESTVQTQFETLQPGKITSTTAEFGALSFVGNTSQTNVVFEYGTSELFGSATPPIAVTKNGTILYTATGLTPNTNYYVRAVLAQGSNSILGNTMTFTTTNVRN